MKKLLALILVVTSLFLVSCAPANAKSTVETYLKALSSLDYSLANSLVVKGEDSLKAEIEQSDENDKIFKNLSFEILNVSKTSDGYCVTLIIKQLSLTTVYIDTISDYTSYVQAAKLQGKTYSDTALKTKWNEFFSKHLSSANTVTSFACEATVTTEGKILMTSQLRNALFGGALDAINNNNL